jgi:L-fuculose-phosphate aldolase
VTADGSPATGGGAPATTEWLLHREIYALRPDAQAVCHGHPAWATAFAASGQGLDGCLLPEAIITFGQVPLAPYATPGTADVPRSIRGLITGHDALLLANHGVVTLGGTLLEAYLRLETVERLAQVTLLARLAGGERRLGPDDLARLPGAGAEPAGPRCRVAGPAGGTGAEELDTLVELLARGILRGLPRGGRG